MINFKRNLLLFCLCLGISPLVHAQNEDKIFNHKKEVGVRTNTFTSLNLTYAIHRKSNRMVRFRAGQLAFNAQPEFNNFMGSISLAVGFQRYKVLNNNFSFYHGIEPGVYTYIQGSDAIDYRRTRFTLGYMVGFSYEFLDNFKAYVEMVPSLNVENIYSTQNINNNFTFFDFNASSQIVGIGLNYKF